MSKPLLILENVNVDYGNAPILRDITMVVKPGEIVGVVGESGSGKSTAIYATLGILGKGGKVVNGTITYDGRDLKNMAPEAKRAFPDRPGSGHLFSSHPEDPQRAVRAGFRSWRHDPAAGGGGDAPGHGENQPPGRTADPVPLCL